MAEEIAEEAGRRYPAYNKVADELGIDGNTTAMEALAEITYIDRGVRKTATSSDSSNQFVEGRRSTTED